MLVEAVADVVDVVGEEDGGATPAVVVVEVLVVAVDDGVVCAAPCPDPTALTAALTAFASVGSIR